MEGVIAEGKIEETSFEKSGETKKGANNRVEAHFPVRTDFDSDPTKKARRDKQAQMNRKIIAEDPEWNLAPIEKLQNICLKAIVANFESKRI